MQITDRLTGKGKDILIESIENEDYKNITKTKFFFNWSKEKSNLVFKLSILDNKEIIGLMSLQHIAQEKRFEIKLLAVSKDNLGKDKRYDGIAGNLIAYACREAVKLYREEGCVSLIPKTTLKKHYLSKYGMIDGGLQLFLEGKQLLDLLTKYGV